MRMKSTTLPYGFFFSTCSFSFRLLKPGLRAFSVYPYLEDGPPGSGGDESEAGYYTLLKRFHDLRNRLFVHLLHFMDQV